ncbi:MAG TPA: hypothetical protein VHU80_16355 [Polyangiaceae bacterium]|nr:hypothetical protein [Polyangiaceae bacterium]
MATARYFAGTLVVISSFTKIFVALSFCAASQACASVEPLPPITDGGVPIAPPGQGGSAQGTGGAPEPGAGGDMPGAGGTIPGAGGTTQSAGGITTAGAAGSNTAGTNAQGGGGTGTCYPMGCPGCILSSSSLFGTPCCTAAGKCGCQAVFTTTCM